MKIAAILSAAIFAFAANFPVMAQASSECPMDLVDKLDSKSKEVGEELKFLRKAMKILNVGPEDIGTTEDELNQMEELLVEAKLQVDVCRNLNHADEVKVISAR